MGNLLKNKSFKKMLPYFLLAVAVIVAFLIINQIYNRTNIFNWIWTVLAPFFYGFVIAYIVNIPYGGIQFLLGKIKIKFINKAKKPIALLLAIALVILIIYLFILFVVPGIVSSISHFIGNIPTYLRDIQNLVEGFENTEIFGMSINTDAVLMTIGGTIERFVSQLTQFSINSIMSIPTTIFTVIIAIISSIFMLIEKETFIKFFRRVITVFVPVNVNGLVIKYTTKLNKNVKKYLYVQTLYGFVCGVLGTVTLAIMGSPFFVLLGFLLGICNYIPYLGSIVATVIAVIFVWFSQGFTMAIVAAVAIFVVQQFGAYVIHPMLMGKSFKFSPLLVLMSVAVGGAIWGIFGMIIAIPIAVVFKDIVVDTIAYFEAKKGKQNTQSDGAMESNESSEALNDVTNEIPKSEA